MDYETKWLRAFNKAIPEYKKYNGGFIKVATREFQFSHEGELCVFTTEIKKEYCTRNLTVRHFSPIVTTWETKSRISGLHEYPCSLFSREIFKDEHLVVFTLEDIDNCKKSLQNAILEFNKDFYGEYK